MKKTILPLVCMLVTTSVVVAQVATKNESGPTIVSQEMSKSMDSDNSEEQTEFSVILKSYRDDSKIRVIKVVRTITGSGLAEAKELVDHVPSTIKEGISKEDADDIKKKLEEAGATVEIK